MDSQANDVAFQEIALQKRMKDLEIMLEKLASLGDMMANKKDAIQALQARLKALKESGSSGANLDAELDDIYQLLNEATSSVKSITQVQLDEISKYKSPPDRIKTALEAIMYLLHKKVLTWDQIKSEMAKGFINSVLKFNLSKVPLKVVQYVKKEYVSKDNWNIEKLKKASKAMGPLGEWLAAQLTLADVYEQKPQAKEVMAHKLEVDEVTEELKIATKELEDLTAEQTQVQATVAQAQQEIEDIKADLEAKKNGLVTRRANRRGSPYSVSKNTNAELNLPPGSKNHIPAIAENEVDEDESPNHSVADDQEQTDEPPLAPHPAAISNRRIQAEVVEEKVQDIPRIHVNQPEPPKPQKNIQQGGIFNFYQQQKQIQPPSVRVSVQAPSPVRVSKKSFIMQTDMNSEELEELKREINDLRRLLDERNRMLDDRNHALITNANLHNDAFEKENEMLKKEIRELYLLLEDRNKQLDDRHNMLISNKHIQTELDEAGQNNNQSHQIAFNDVQTDPRPRQFSSKDVQTDLNSRYSMMMMQTEEPHQRIVVDSSAFLDNHPEKKPVSFKVQGAPPTDQDDAGAINPHMQSIIDDLTKRKSDQDVSLAYPESFKDLGILNNQRASNYDYVPDQSPSQSQLNIKPNNVPIKEKSEGTNLPLTNTDPNKKFVIANGNAPSQPVVIVRRTVLLKQAPVFIQQTSTTERRPSRNNSPTNQKLVPNGSIIINQGPRRVSKTSFIVQGSPSEIGIGQDRSRSPMLAISRINGNTDNDSKTINYSFANPVVMAQKTATNVSNEVNYGELGPVNAFNPRQIDHIIIKNGEGPRLFENVHRQSGVVTAEQLPSILQSNSNPPLEYSQAKIFLNQPPVEGNNQMAQKYESANQGKRATVVTRQVMSTTPVYNQLPISVSPVNGYINGDQILRGEPVSVIVRKAPEAYEPDVPLEYSTPQRGDRANAVSP